MKKLTAEKCREKIEDLKYSKVHGYLSITAEYYLQALEIALPILEQQESGCESCGGNGHVEINHGEMGIEHMTCHKCVGAEQQESEGASND